MWVILIAVVVCAIELWTCRTVLHAMHQSQMRQNALLETIAAEASSQLKYHRPQSVRIVSDERQEEFGS